MIDPKSLRIGNYSPLFQEIMGAMYEPLHATTSQEDAEKAAREIESRVMKWIKLAFIDGDKCYDFILWAKEKGLDPFAGLTPTEPDTKEPVIGTNGIINGKYQEEV